MWIAKKTNVHLLMEIVYLNTKSGIGSSNNIISIFIGTIRWRERNKRQRLFHSQVINRPN